MAFTSGRWQKPSSTSAEALDIFAKTADLVKSTSGTEPPHCPVCGSNMISRSDRWRCPYCGKRIRKNKKGPKLKDDRPNCPDCGAKPNSEGVLWRCTRCDRRWMKKYKKKNKVEKIKFYPLNIDSIKEFLEWRNRG